MSFFVARASAKTYSGCAGSFANGSFVIASASDSASGGARYANLRLGALSSFALVEGLVEGLVEDIVQAAVEIPLNATQSMLQPCSLK
jgi:hypothetical protein